MNEKIEALEARIGALEEYCRQLRGLLEEVCGHDRDVYISMVRRRETALGIAASNSALHKRRSGQ